MVDDHWLYQVTQNAGYVREDDLRLSTAGSEESIEVDNTYEKFYNNCFPTVYLVQELDWFTPATRDPHAIFLFAVPIGRSRDNVIFRLDKHDQLCAHARNVAATDAMIAFARKTLPTLPKLIKETLDERERLTAAGKSWPRTKPLRQKRKTRQA